MNNFDVVDGDMEDRRLTDAEIEALIEGRPVAGAPAQLTDLLAALRHHADTDVPASAALDEFFVTGESSGAQSSVSGEGGTVLVLRRRRASSLVKAASIVGLVPVPLLIGATMAAAAALGGAHAVGLVDVPLLPDHTAPIEVIVPIMPETDSPPPSDTSRVAGQDSGTRESPEVDAASKPSAAVASARQHSREELVPADRDAAAPALPNEAAVQGTPGCEFGQEVPETHGAPRTTTTVSRADTARDLDIGRPVDPCEQAMTPTPPVPHSDNGRPDDAGPTTPTPHNGGQPPAATPPAASPPVTPVPKAPSMAPVPPVNPPTDPGAPRTP